MGRKTVAAAFDYLPLDLHSILIDQVAATFFQLVVNSFKLF